MAHTHQATIVWHRDGTPFIDNKYSRAHVWRFDGGVEVPASSSPSVVRLPFSRADAVDPEEALVAALSSCHMLSFLHVAAKDGFVIDSYEDTAIGVMGRNAAGKTWVQKVTLKPVIRISGTKQPTAADMERLHHLAHEECFIANSVKTEVVVEAQPVVSAAA
jgi:organic hydroperoxide reductase OsmC/OhrA